MKRSILAIIADDLTGAMDTAAVFALRGLACDVVVDGDLPQAHSVRDVLCINTQSRTMPPPRAAQVVRTLVTGLRSLGSVSIYKKIDSTMRGNVGAETEAAIAAFGANLALVCPSFPQMGRTVRDGRLMVQGRDLTQVHEGGFQQDGGSSSSVIEILQSQTELPVGHLALETITSGATEIGSEIVRASGTGTRIIVADSTSQGHLEALVEAVSNLDLKIILTGSAGLASALASRMASEFQNSRPPTTADGVEGHFVLIAGSLNQVTRAQVKQAAAMHGVEAVRVPTSVVLGTQGGQEDGSSEFHDSLNRALNGTSDICLFWDDPDLLERRIVDAAGARAALRRFARAIEPALREKLVNGELSGLILVGGETAYEVLAAIGATEVRVVGEVFPGIPWGRMNAGVADGRWLVTKAGGFGEEAALVNVIEHVRSTTRGRISD